MAELDDPTLVDPDGEEEARYSWDEEFQRHVISMLVSDRQFILQSLDIVKPSYFTNKAHQKTCKIVFDFFRKYRVLPRKDFIVQEIKQQLKENKGLTYYLAEVNVLYDYFQPGLDHREYLQDKITYFAKIQAVKNAFNESLKEIGKEPESEETWEKVYERMRTAMTTTQNFEVGVDYFRSFKDRYAQKKEEEESLDKFITGYETLDKQISGGGYNRGEMISVIAASGVGKSVWLANLTATNLLRGKKGVYITLELAETKVADRMDSILTGFPIQCLCSHQHEIESSLGSLKGILRPENGLGSLVIKQFPAGTASVNTIRAYIAQLRFRGFDPDFVIVDYVGEMQPFPGIPTHESRERIVRDLRAMATEENVFVATAMQPNREAKKDSKQGERNRIDEEHLADSYGQIRPLDGALSLNQNDTEKKLGIGRAFVIKQRDGDSKYQFYLKFNKDNLRITELSNEKYREILNAHKEYASEDIKVDKVVGSWPTEEDGKDPD